MVFTIALTHGHYRKEYGGTMTIPHNIRLVLYTNPGTPLNDIESKFIYKQVIPGGKRFIPSILNLENNDDDTFEIFPFPIIEVLKPFKIGSRIFEQGERHYPRGQFYMYEPNTTAQNFGIHFGGDFRTFLALQTPSGTIRIPNSNSDNTFIQDIERFINNGETYNSMGEFLRLISNYYDSVYPGRIVTLLHMSCRVGDYDTVEELTQKLNVLRLNPNVGHGIGYVRPPPPPGILLHEHGNTMKDAYMYTTNPDPSSYTKGIYTNKLVLYKNNAILVPLNSGGNRRSGTQRRRRYRRLNSRKKRYIIQTKKQVL